MIDLHTHILPQMDDGSKSPEESIKLWEMLQAQGATKIAATSHFYPDQEAPEDYLARREKAVTMLPRELADNLILGAEVAYFPNLGNCRAIAPLHLGNTNLLLVEMPFCDWTDRIVEDICSIPNQLGLTPVLAHINRYRGKSQFPKYCHRLAQSDVLFQCNAEAFVPGMTGRWALGQLKKGWIHFLGSDTHNTTSRPPKLDQAAQFIEKKLGSGFLPQFHEQADCLLEQYENP